MAYIGKKPQVGNYIKLDAISTSSTNTYDLKKDTVLFTPESALHMLVSLNGVIQSPLTSFSVSGSTITFLPSSGTLSSSDTIDFILVLGNVLDIGTPSDSTVTNAKTNFVSTSSSAGLTIKGDGTTDGTSGTLQLNCSFNTHGIKLASPAHTHGQSYTLTFPTTAPSADKALITDGSGNLSFGSAGGLTKLYTNSTTSSANSIDIGDTFINTTYDTYFVVGSALPPDNTHLYLKLKNSSGIITGSLHGYDLQYLALGEESQGGDFIKLNYSTVGGSTGEGVQFQFHISHVNSSNIPCTVMGSTKTSYTDGNPEAVIFQGGMISTAYAQIIKGFNLSSSNGNPITAHDITIYGLVK